MKPIPLLSLALLAASLLVSPRTHDLADIDSPATIQKLVDDGDYKTAMRELSRILALQGSAAAAYDRYQMYMLRAECQLQTHVQPAALDALNAARKEAFKQNQPLRAVDPVAFTDLILHCKSYQYYPKVAGNPPPIPLLDRKQRKAAYAALFADEFPDAQKKLKLLPSIKTLPALIDLAKTAGTIRAIEFSATQDSFLTAPLTHAVADQADQFINLQLDQYTTRLAAITQNANQLIQEPYSQSDYVTKKSVILTRTRRQGPSQSEIQYLQNVQATTDKISASIIDLAEALIFETDTMKSMVAKSNALKLQAKSLLTDNYLNIPTP